MKYLIDTNVLIYRIDKNDSAKQQRARDVLRMLVDRQTGAVSTQALVEYSNVALKRYALPADRIATHIHGFKRVLTVHDVTPGVVLEALRGVKHHKFSYFDAQMWAVAKLHQADFIVSEDFNPGSTLEGVTFLNPFAEDFELELLA